MELRAGYKQTEVGVIPEDWDLINLGEIFGFKNGLNKSKEFFGYGTPIVNYMDVFQNAGLRITDVLGRVNVNRNELKAYEVRKGDVFFTRTSETVEEIGVASAMLDEPSDTVFSGFVLRARPTDESLDDEFKKYCFSATYFRQQVTSRASYTTRALTNGRSLSATLLVRPPLPEQCAIAAALSETDALIASLDALVAKKRDLKQAAMQQLLTGKTRLPGFKGEWEMTKVGELGTVVTGGTPRTDNLNYWHGSIPWITPTDITGRRGISESARQVTEKGLAQLRPLPENSVLVTCIASIGKNAILKSPGACNQQINAIIPNKNFSPEFLYYLMDFNKSYLLGKAGVTATSIISKRDFVEIPFLVPRYDEQAEIALILCDMDTDLESLEARRDKAQALKQGMMQELLTGRIRLV